MIQRPGWSPFLGRVALLGRPALGRVPRFDITIKNGGVMKTVSAAFDTGLQGFDMEMPSSLAYELGIVPTGVGQSMDYSQSFRTLVGVADEVTIPSSPGCSLKKVVVSYSSDLSQVMIGDGFLKAIGAQISYQNGAASIVCGQAPSGSKVLAPAFLMTFIQGQKVMTTDAYFDTGFDSDLAMPESMANQMGLVVTSHESFGTHTGTVLLGKAKMDRLAIKDLPNCSASNIDVFVSPSYAPLQDVLVGEGFLKKVGGKVGYDQSGAFLSCAASSLNVSRAVAYTHFTEADVPIFGAGGLGVVMAVAGVLILGVIGYHLISGSSS